MGLLISLHGATTTALSVRLAFVLAIALMSIGLLCGAVAIYLLSIVARKNMMEDYRRKLSNAYENGVPMEPVSGGAPPFFSKCEKICYTSLVLSVFALTSYVILLSF
jgi:hypothetical protein